MPGDETEEHWFRVINNSGAAQKYIFFAPPPSSDFLTPAWIASDNINNETVWDIHTTAYLYAGVGTLEGNHVNIDEGHWWDSGIRLGGPEIFNLVFEEGGPKLQETGENAQSPNTFTVVTKDIPNDDKTYVIAFGKRQQHNDPQDLGPVHACAAIPVKQNNSQHVTPIIQLHVFNIPTTPGDLIDYGDFKEKSAHINFAGHTEDAALCTVLHKTGEDSNAVWDTAYDNTLPEL
ncbi:hypothetical protein AtubIFM57143_008517 [Aspergillus tubingensis]|uniref:Uncharacterized protein n=2 Tax=Aspergillus subgen. Circumdati TaxID=2720871 RepID=A0A1L9NGM4_ASPTC|nr:hypothetical protein ASPTUDRAFT_195972 [Aspergillus tubingensis CBS 134.48]GAQ47017.1 hypothetical protein An05g01590 [Aspergillus niger]GLA99817.1 hypothetical protein AtubIFM57143_008517 [Aspergillus tubingensis]